MNGSARLLLLGATAVVCVVAARAQDDPVGDALRAADDLAERGRFREAIAALERDRARLTALDPEGWAEHGPKTLALYRTFVAEEERFERAVAEAAQQRTAALEAWVREVEAGGYKHVGYAFVDRWRARARAALGDEAYRKIVSDLEGEALQAMPLDDVLKTDPEAEVEGPTITAPAVQRRGSAERRARMRAQAEADRATLARVRAEVAAVESARAARERAAAERARGSKLGGHTLLGWDASGFTVVDASGREVSTSWDETDPLTAVWVRGRGVPSEDAEALHDWGRFALTRGCFDVAEHALAQAAAIDSRWARPDLDLADLRRRAAPFRAGLAQAHDERGSLVAWSFDDPLEALDHRPVSETTDVEVAGGELRVRCSTSSALARVRGAWEQVTVDVAPASLEPAIVIGLSCAAARVFAEVGRDRARLHVVASDREVEVARVDHGGATGDVRVVGAIEQAGGAARLRVQLLLGGRPLLVHELAWPVAAPIEVLVGATGAEARLEAVTVTGGLVPGFLERARGASLGDVVREVKRADAARGRDDLAIAWRATNAEDDVALEGVGELARGLLAEGRELVRMGKLDHALATFEAARDQAPDCAVALYLSGRARLELGDVQGALERARAADAQVEDFVEAWALEAAALLRWARLDEAEAALDRALTLAPASPLAWRARADLLARRGDRAGAREAIAVAAALAPGDRELALAAAQGAAIAAEPTLGGRVELDGIVFLNDLPAAQRSALSLIPVEQQELIDRLPAALPFLAKPGSTSRTRRVVLLDSPLTFHRCLALRGASAGPETTAFTDPVAGDVFVLRERGWSLHRLRRGLVRVWLEEQGALGLPPWVREGLALCFAERWGPALGGAWQGASPAGLDQLATLAVGWPRRPRFFDLAAGIRRPPELAFPELDDALAWALFAHCLTPGARAERFEGGQVVLADVLADYLGRLAAPSGEKARLEHAWVETFHTLDRRSLEEGVERALREQATRAGIDWPAR